MALTAREIAVELTPQARAALAQRRADFIARAGGLLRREAAQLLWPTLVAEVPTGLEWGLDAFLTRCGQLTVDDLLTMVVNHTKSKGLTPHPSYMERPMSSYATQDDFELEQMKSEAIEKAQRHLETSPELEPATFGAGPPVAVYAGYVPGVVISLFEVAMQQGAEYVLKHRQEIVDFVALQAATAVSSIANRLKNIHLGK